MSLVTLASSLYHILITNLQGQTLLRGTLENGLYRLPSSCQPSPLRAFFGERTSLECWHRRLAHPTEPILRRLVSTFSLPITSSSLPNICDSCQLGKSHRLHLPKRLESSKT
ncbi:unnamed protein product, partial [Cuscuta epithymum]